MSITASLDNALSQLQLIFPTLALPRPIPGSLGESLTVLPSRRSVSARHCLSPTLPPASAVSPPCGSSSTNNNTSINDHSSTISPMTPTLTPTPSSKKRNVSTNKPPQGYWQRKRRSLRIAMKEKEIWWMMFGDGKRKRMTPIKNIFFSLIDIF